MLKHENPSSLSSAAQERVGADELARALSAIESRRQEQAKSLAGTLSIGDAVRELDLDATPEEVWAEVQSQRTRAQSSSQTPPPAAAPPAPAPLPQTLGTALRDAALAAAPGLKQAALSAAPPLKQGWDAARQHLAAQNAAKSPWRSEQAKRGMTAFAVGCGLLWIMAGTGTLPPLHSPSAPVIMLSTVPDNHPVSADTATLQAVQTGNTAVRVRDTPSLDDNWTLIRHNGHWYVRGFTLPHSDKTLRASGAKVYTDDNAGVLQGVQDAKVTLRLDTLHVDDANSGQGWHEIDVSGVQTDAFTREDW